MKSTEWPQSFLKIKYRSSSLASRLLSGKIHFQASKEVLRQDLVSRASAILAIQPKLSNIPRRIVVQQAGASPAEARLLILALACTALASRHHYPDGSAEAIGPLLFVTQQITRCRDMLESVKLDTVPITDVYPVLSLPRPSEARHQQAIYLANPGRLTSIAQQNRFWAVVIDATHPRSFVHLENLLKCAPIHNASIQVVLEPLGNLPQQSQSDTLYWLWDPLSIHELGFILNSSITPSDKNVFQRHYWIAEAPEIEASLTELHKLLAQAMALTNQQVPTDLFSAWQIYHRFRELSIPLEHAERSWRHARYNRTIREQINELNSLGQFGPYELRTFFAIHAPRIIELFEELYTNFARGREPDKFYVAASVLSTLISEANESIRVVSPTEDESHVLADFMAVLVDGVSMAIEDGRLEFVHQREEARRVADERFCITLLFGARTSRYRYLDAFPKRPVHLVTYGYEAHADQRALDTMYRDMQRYTCDRYRCSSLIKLGIRDLHEPEASDVESDQAASHVVIHGNLDHKQLTVHSIDPAPFVLEWTSLSPEKVTDSTGIRSRTDLSISLPTNMVIVVDADGYRYRYLEEECVDVYYPEINEIRRINAGELHIGDQLILLLDDRYDALFERLLEAIDDRRPWKETLLLERWRAAKRKVFDIYKGNRAKIHTALGSELSVGYPAVVGWFHEEHNGNTETLGPQSYDDFTCLARLSGVYRDENDLQQTFDAIAKERINRRKLGRALRKALKVLIGGASYDAALKAANALDTSVYDVIHAIEIREVVKVERENDEGSHK